MNKLCAHVGAPSERCGEENLMMFLEETLRTKSRRGFLSSLSELPTSEEAIGIKGSRFTLEKVAAAGRVG